MRIKQVYVHYLEWEDYINGMWRSLPKNEEAEMLTKAIDFTGNHLLYGKAMREVIYAWPKTMLNSLTNTSLNQRAFVGHCACAYRFSCPEYITRMAWKELTNLQRFEADKVAQEAINSWKIFHYNKKQLRIAF
jgi:hypothetical protein